MDIYDTHRKAFERVSAFVILTGGERVATVALKFPADGAGRLWAYVHILGSQMVRGFAGGYGYDKRSAAVAAAGRKLADDTQVWKCTPEKSRAFLDALRKDGGQDWTRAIEDAGFQVLQAV